MPYKDKEDQVEAQRRYRQREKEKQLTMAKAEKFEVSLAYWLRQIGFEDIPFEDLVESFKNIEKDDQGVWHDRKRGKVVYPPEQVFFGSNTLIAGNHLDEQVNAIAEFFHRLKELVEHCNSEG